MTSVAKQPTSVPRWQRRLLPGELLEAPGGRRSPRDWAVDALLFVAAMAVGVASLAETTSDHSDAVIVLDVVVGTAACGLLWIRRRHPVGVAAAVVTLAAFSATAGGAAPVVVFNAAVRAARRALLGIVAGSLASMVILQLLDPGPGSVEGQILLGILILGVALGWGLFARARHEVVQSLRDRAERLESEERMRIAQAREAERRRIAREMHDVLAHRLSLLSVHAGALEFRPDAPSEEIAEAAGVIREAAQSALQELREVIGVLRDDADEPPLQPPQPTLAQIPALVEESRAAGMRVHWRDEARGSDEVPDAIGRTAYRVVQEGLTNARKHAPAAAVEVTVSTDDRPALVVEVVSRRAVGAPSTTDLDALPGAGTGLVGLTERVDLAGGELQHGPNSDGDFILRATLPWSP